MAVLVKDVKDFPKDAPKELLLDKHIEFLSNYGKDDTYYEFVMAEFLRINGVYWSYTAFYLMGGEKKTNFLEAKEFLENSRTSGLA